MKRHAPATDRNRDAILAVLREVMPASGLVLEIASGTGQHAAYFAAALPHLEWQPTDRDPSALASIAEWTADVPNVRPPIVLDVTEPWPVDRADAIVNINMIHIAPWEACEALIAGAAKTLREHGVLFMYGPYLQRETATAPSNLAFDESLRATDPRWGIRDLEHVTTLAREHGLVRTRVVSMPANNLSVVYVGDASLRVR